MNDLSAGREEPRSRTSGSTDQHFSTPHTHFEPLLSAEAAARLLGIHPVTLLRWSREQQVPHHRLGRRVLYRISELNSWITANQTCGFVAKAA